MERIHRIAGATLSRLQGMPLYRRLGQQIASRMTLREVTDADRLAVHRWLNPNVNPAQVKNRNFDATEWVAEYRSHLAGFVQLVRYPPEHFPYVGNWLFALYVKPACRGLGVGQALSRAVIERSRAEGAPTVDLLVYKDNVRAIELYGKLGFKMFLHPGLEAQLDSERASSGRRRVAMRKRLADQDVPKDEG